MFAEIIFMIDSENWQQGVSQNLKFERECLYHKKIWNVNMKQTDQRPPVQTGAEKITTEEYVSFNCN